MAKDVTGEKKSRKLSDWYEAGVLETFFRNAF